MKRPAGFIIMSWFIGWLALAGFANAFIGPAQGLERLGALIYGVTAAVAVRGLWKVRQWALVAYLAWCGAVVLLMISMQYGGPRIEWPEFFGFACFIVLVLALPAIYVRKTLRKIVEPIGAANPPPPLASEGR